MFSLSPYRVRVAQEIITLHEVAHVIPLDNLGVQVIECLDCDDGTQSVIHKQ